MRALAVLPAVPGLLLLTVFATWQGRLAALVLLLAAAALWTRRRTVLLPLAAGLAILLWQAPPGPWQLRLSPLNLVPETDLVRLGLRLFYPGPPGRRVADLALPLYTDPPEATAVTFTALDVLGLGTGAGHAYSRQGDGPMLLFLHGALGNFQSYRKHWELYHPGRFTVVCPTFGFGSWYRPGGTETALQAVDRARQAYGCPPGQTVLAGMSNGATGALRALAARPEEFAALVLISPVLEPDRVTAPAFVKWGRTHPVLVLEGSEDVNVRPASVERGVRLMQEAGVDVDYLLLPGHDHFLMFSARAELFQALDLRLNLKDARQPGFLEDALDARVRAQHEAAAVLAQLLVGADQHAQAGRVDVFDVLQVQVKVVVALSQQALDGLLGLGGGLQIERTFEVDNHRLPVDPGLDTDAHETAFAT